MFPIVEETCRAIQAVQGIVSFTLHPDQRGTLLTSFTEDVYESLFMIQSHTSELDEQSAIEYCTPHLENSRSFFFDILKTSKFPIFTENNNERIWKLFVDRYDLSLMQLRANLADMHSCFNISELVKIINQEEKYFHQLPMSVEIIITVNPGGTAVEVEIPARLLFLDMLLMFKHAIASHNVLSEWVKERSSPEPLSHRAKLDAYVRQVVITGACVCESVLSDYGMLVESIQKHKNLTATHTSFSKTSFSARLSNFISVWSEMLEFPALERPEFLDDMLKLVQVRNRLVHYDGRISAWHAFHIDFNWIAQQGFSDRVKEFLNVSEYGLKHTLVGYETSFAEFYIDTVVKTIDLIHQTIYRDTTQAIWLNLPRTQSARIDLSEIYKFERMLEI
jgi:hypothetical protein